MKIIIKVKPNSSQEKVEKISENEFIVWLREKAEKGKANEQLTKILAKEFGVSSKNIFIKNPASRKKIVEIILC